MNAGMERQDAHQLFAQAGTASPGRMMPR
jgi:hypothetical protein